MFNMPLGTGLFDPQDTQGPSPWNLGSGLYGQPPLSTIQPQMLTAAGAAGGAPAAPQAGGLEGFLNSPMAQIGLALIAGTRGANGPANAVNTLIGLQSNSQKQKAEQARLALAQQQVDQTKAYQTGELDIGNRKAATEELNAQTNQGLRQDQAKKIEEEIANMRAIRDVTDKWRASHGGQQPAAPGAPQPQPQAVPAQQAPGGVGPFGTPSAILDNLERTESSGNPNALGPELPDGTRAMGAYQFLPGTVSLLKSKGMAFNPMDREQARDAADFYISKVLLPQNNGDLRGALAQYGGFKTKDPTPYVNKVMGITTPPAAPVAPVGQVGQPVSGQVGQPFAQPPAQATINNPGSDQADLLTLAAPIAMLKQDPGALANVAGQMAPHLFGKFMQAQPGGPMVEMPQTSYEAAAQKADLAQKGADTQLAQARVPQTQAETQLAQARIPQTQAETQLTAARIPLTQAEAAKTAVGTQQAQAALGETQRKNEKEKAADLEKYYNVLSNMDRLERATDELKSHPGKWAVAGPLSAGGLAGKLPGDPTAAASLLDSIKGGLSQDVMQAMKAESPNGSMGFGGRITNTEYGNFNKSITSLVPGLPNADFDKRLGEIRNFTGQAKTSMDNYLRSTYGDDAVDQVKARVGQRSGGQGGAVSLDDYLKGK